MLPRPVLVGRVLISGTKLCIASKFHGPLKKRYCRRVSPHRKYIPIDTIVESSTILGWMPLFATSFPWRITKSNTYMIPVTTPKTVICEKWAIHLSERIRNQASDRRSKGKIGIEV